MSNLKLVYIDEKYIKYLYNFDKNVMYNKNQKRPYLGVLFEVENHKYYAPLTSPKPKFTTMHNKIDFYRIDEGKLGAINFNNMIPAIDDAIIKIDFNNLSDFRYKLLLINQLKFLDENDVNIINKAIKLYNSFKQNKLRDEVKNRCCNFTLLEEKSKQYQ